MIDWAFIGSLEGRKLQGYVPDSGKSGVTIATGCDLGHITTRDLAQMPAPLPTLFKTYLGLVDHAAQEALARVPLIVTSAEADAIDRVMFSADMDGVCAQWQRDEPSGGPIFSALPYRAQTVIASVAFQYGVLRRKTPHFWALCLTRNWAAVVHELRNFGDAYNTRRNDEANYLEPLVTA